MSCFENVRHGLHDIELMQKRSIDVRWSLAKRRREQFEQRERPDDYLRSGSEKPENSFIHNSTVSESVVNQMIFTSVERAMFNGRAMLSLCDSYTMSFSRSPKCQHTFAHNDVFLVQKN